MGVKIATLASRDGLMQQVQIFSPSCLRSVFVDRFFFFFFLFSVIKGGSRGRQKGESLLNQQNLENSPLKPARNVPRSHCQGAVITSFCDVIEKPVSLMAGLLINNNMNLFRCIYPPLDTQGCHQFSSPACSFLHCDRGRENQNRLHHPASCRLNIKVLSSLGDISKDITLKSRFSMDFQILSCKMKYRIM